MLKLPGRLDAEQFLARYWQKAPLFLPGALERLRPCVTRNELAWLATLEDVESRIVFTDRTGNRLRYRATTGPFDEAFLAGLPRRDWTLLVHDVEKHLPSLRRLFAHVPFIPDWRIDDLMVSFAAPGGGVGPHRDNYDVFLCQGVGTREWHVTDDEIPDDPGSSTDLALCRPFAGATHTARQGDVLYLPPGAAHWGTATRACITYSIGMRAPQRADLMAELPDDEGENPYYRDPDLALHESLPGYISAAAVRRAQALLEDASARGVGETLGRFVTSTKEWLTPEPADEQQQLDALQVLDSGGRLAVHGMARIAFDDHLVYVNGRSLPLPPAARDRVAAVCRSRVLRGPLGRDAGVAELVTRMLESGAFDLTGNL